MRAEMFGQLTSGLEAAWSKLKGEGLCLLLAVLKHKAFEKSLIVIGSLPLSFSCQFFFCWLSPFIMYFLCFRCFNEGEHC